MTTKKLHFTYQKMEKQNALQPSKLGFSLGTIFQGLFWQGRLLSCRDGTFPQKLLAQAYHPKNHEMMNYGPRAPFLNYVTMSTYSFHGVFVGDIGTKMILHDIA
jgi:hypothetical protein